jgi:heme exporter protein A
MLEAADLGCVRGGRTLFDSLSFVLKTGEALRITGANGSGKTSLLRILCGLLSPTRGEVRWRGQPIRRLAEEYSRELVHVGHAPGLKDELTAAENLEITCALAGIAVSTREAHDSLAGFGLPPGKPVRQLSQGQRRRAALARLALSANVPLWVLDEPFAALDASATSMVEGLIREHAGRGGAVLYSAHQASSLDAAARSVSL